MAEYFNRTLLDYLSKFVNEDQKNWDKKINWVCWHIGRNYKMMMAGEILDLILGGSPNANSYINLEWVSNFRRNPWGSS